VLATNAVFRLATTWLFREYSPGVVTRALLFLPATGYVVGRAIAERLLTAPQLMLALVLGTLAGGGVIASLWLPMDLDWRLRRRS